MNTPTRLNNPGDLKDPTTGKFQQFSNPQQGFQALKNDLMFKMSGKGKRLGPQSTLAQFAEVYAPTSDNAPKGLAGGVQYAAKLAKQLGVDINATIGSLKPRLDDFAKAIATNEGYAFGGIPTAHADEMPQKPRLTLADLQAKYGSTQNTAPKPRLTLADLQAKYGKAQQAQQPQQSAGQSIGQLATNVKDVFEGGAKQAVGGLNSLGRGVEDVLGAGYKTATGKDVPIPASQTGIPDKYLQLNNTQQKIGAGAEAVGELLGGGKGLTSLASRGVELARGIRGTLRLVQPVATKRVAVQAIKEGLGETAKWLKPASLSADKATVQAAKAVHPIIQGARTYIERANRTRDAIIQESNVLKSKLSERGARYVQGEFEKAMLDAKKELPGLLRHEPALSKTFDDVVQRVIDASRQGPQEVADLLDLRQAFDQFAEQEFGNIYSNTARDMTPVKQSVKAVRNTMNDFIEKHVPDLGYKESLHYQSSLFDALDTFAEKAAKEVGKTGIKLWAQNHPIMSKALEIGAGVAGYQEAKKVLPLP